MNIEQMAVVLARTGNQGIDFLKSSDCTVDFTASHHLDCGGTQKIIGRIEFNLTYGMA